MELIKDTPKSIDLGFQVPEPGTFIWQIQEGIEKFYNENSGKTSLKIPLKVDSVVDGPADPVGQTCAHFIPIETGFGEKQLACLLSITGLMEPFIQKYGAEVDPLDDKFLAGLKLKLPGKMIQATHEVRENNKGQKNVNFTNFSAIGNASAKRKAGGEPTVPPAQQQASEDAW
jgi:hypothetical protein